MIAAVRYCHEIPAHANGARQKQRLVADRIVELGLSRTEIGYREGASDMHNIAVHAIFVGHICLPGVFIVKAVNRMDKISCIEIG